MRVLYLTMNPNRQSTTVPTEGWFRFLRDRGLHPVLVSRETGAFQEWVKGQGIPVYQDDLPFPNRRDFLPFLRSMWHLRGIVRRHGIDLIHCNEQEIYPPAQYLARACGIPVVVSVHFNMDEAFCRWAFTGPRAPARMFFVSRRSMEACEHALRDVVPADRWSVLHNGLDLDAYHPDDELRHCFREAHHLGADDQVIGAACAFRPRKQLEHLIDAAARLKSRDVKVLLAGFAAPGDESYAAQLIQLAKDRLGSRLCFVGALSDMRGFGNALDLFVNTSREESFGISVLEALACGCPVVGYDSKAVDEVVLPDGGEIVEQDNVDALVSALDRWLTDPGRLKQFRQSARKQAERFDLRVLSDQLWREYLSLFPEPT